VCSFRVENNLPASRIGSETVPQSDAGPSPVLTVDDSGVFILKGVTFRGPPEGLLTRACVSHIKSEQATY
jgi:hypothetical protein